MGGAGGWIEGGWGREGLTCGLLNKLSTVTSRKLGRNGGKSLS